MVSVYQKNQAEETTHYTSYILIDDDAISKVVIINDIFQSGKNKLYVLP